MTRGCHSSFSFQTASKSGGTRYQFSLETLQSQTESNKVSSYLVVLPSLSGGRVMRLATMN